MIANHTTPSPRNLTASQEALWEGIELSGFSVKGRPMADIVAEIDFNLGVDVSQNPWECEDHGDYCWIRVGNQQIHLHKNGRVEFV